MLDNVDADINIVVDKFKEAILQSSEAYKKS